MLPGFNLQRPEHPPKSAEEAVSMAQEILCSSGVEGISVSLTQPATGSDGFAGAQVELLIPEKSLEFILQRIVKTKAAEHGAKVSNVAVRLLENGPQSARFVATAEGRMMMASLLIKAEGELFASGGQKVGLRNLTLDPGKGMFASMASAMARPAIANLEGNPMDLRKFTQMDLRVEHLSVENSTLKIRMSA